MKKIVLIFFLAVAIAVMAAIFWHTRAIAPVDEIKTRNIELYYYASEIDKDSTGNVMCSRRGLVSVSRQIPVTSTPVQDAVNLLIKGQLTENEKKTGLAAEFPLSGLALRGANLEDGILTLEFDDPQNKTGGGSCRSATLWFQIEATAKQFAGISEVRFIPETLFQP
ncbi:MAG: GerMN domain-containing protein [Minisyncoccales bacterium]